MVFRIVVLVNLVWLSGCGGEGRDPTESSSPSPASVSSPENTPTASPSPSPTPEPLPTGDPVTLTDMEGDTRVEYVIASQRLNTLLSNPNEHALFKSVLAFSFPLPETGEPGVYDVNTTSERTIFVYLRHNESLTVENELGSRIPISVNIGPKNYGKIEDSGLDLTGFIEWEFEAGVLVMQVHPNATLDQYITNQRTPFENPLEWKIQPLESTSGEGVLFDITLPEETSVQYIADIARPSNSPVEILPPPHEERGTFFYIRDNLPHWPDSISSEAYMAETESTGSLRDKDYFRLDGGDPRDYALTYRNRDYQPRAQDTAYEFIEGLLLDGWDSSWANVKIATEYIEEDQAYRYVSYYADSNIDRNDEMLKNQVIEDFKTLYREHYFRDSPYNHDSYLTYSEDLVLSILNDGVYVPNSGQGQNPDIDGDGVPNAEDGDPLDPEETLDSDGDGIGDNGDACPNSPGYSVHDGCRSSS